MGNWFNRIKHQNQTQNQNQNQTSNISFTANGNESQLFMSQKILTYQLNN